MQINDDDDDDDDEMSQCQTVLRRFGTGAEVSRVRTILGLM